MNNITIRSAEADDVTFIARCVMAAAGVKDLDEPAGDDRHSTAFMEVCGIEHSLYYWNHVRIAVDDLTGTAVGCLVAYDGRRYARSREMTFGYIAEKLGMTIEETDMETCKGEYYLDSMAILPEYRGRNIGKMLIEDAVSQGFAEGHNRFTLIAEKEAASLQSYYSSIGFVPEEEIIFFGHPYVRMVRCIV